MNRRDRERLAAARQRTDAADEADERVDDDESGALAPPRSLVVENGAAALAEAFASLLSPLPPPSPPP